MGFEQQLWQIAVNQTNNRRRYSEAREQQRREYNKQIRKTKLFKFEINELDEINEKIDRFLDENKASTVHTSLRKEDKFYILTLVYAIFPNRE